MKKPEEKKNEKERRIIEKTREGLNITPCDITRGLHTP